VVVGGGHTLALYRCTPAAEGPPFGGRDLGRRASFTGERAIPGAAQAAEVASRVGAQVRARWSAFPTRVRLGLGFLPVVVLGLGAFALFFGFTPASKAERLLEQGEPAAALAFISAQPTSGPALERIRARSLHALRRHGDELDVAFDAPTVAALVEDFARNERSTPHRELLGKVDPELFGDLFDENEPSWTSWGALRAADLLHDGKPLDRVDAYAAFLGDEDCTTRAVAARRLGELGDDDAVTALERLAALPKEAAFLGEKNCGQDEARAAVKKLGGKKK
jgi:serine/threonine-protein kinase